MKDLKDTLVVNSIAPPFNVYRRKILENGNRHNDLRLICFFLDVLSLLDQVNIYSGLQLLMCTILFLSSNC